MHTIYLLSVWLHLIAVIFWLGGMLFLVAVALPVLRKGDPRAAGEFLSQAAVRLRGLGWISLAILGITGLFQLSWRGWLAPALWTGGHSFSWLLWGKVSIFLVLVAMSAFHDFSFGPRAAQAMAANPTAPETVRMRKWASRLGRLTALLALVMVALGVMLVRGTP